MADNPKRPWRSLEEMKAELHRRDTERKVRVEGSLPQEKRSGGERSKGDQSGNRGGDSGHCWPGGLPLRSAERIKAGWDGCHPGLAFTKFIDAWKRGGKGIETGGVEKKTFLRKIVQLMKSHETGEGKELFGQFLRRRETLFESLGESGWLLGEPIKLSSSWRLVSGVGMPHPLETGFVFDHTFGVPYLPGSSVKGAARAWAEEQEEQWDYETCKALFGPDPNPPHWQGKPVFLPDRGNVVFFDAYPESWPELEVDILNPHYKEYYQGGESPPADWLSPEPTYFLTIKAGTNWKFRVAVPPKLGASGKDLLSRAEEAVERAAREMGFGSKTSVGYGYFK